MALIVERIKETNISRMHLIVTNVNQGNIVHREKINLLFCHLIIFVIAHKLFSIFHLAFLNLRVRIILSSDQ